MRSDAFPRRFANNGRFRLGGPGEFTVSPDGRRVAFLRSESGTDQVRRLRVLDVDTGSDRLVAGPAVLLAGRSEHVPAAERARRERSRAGSGGIVPHSTDRAAGRTAFALSGRAWSADLASRAVAEAGVAGPAIDPQIDPPNPAPHTPSTATTTAPCCPPPDMNTRRHTS
jgi:dipeptidyl-peptidase-4